MKAFFTLLRLHFTGTPVHRVTSMVGLFLILPGYFGMLRYQQYLFMGFGFKFSNASIAFSAILGLTPLIGILMLFLGGGLMPIILVRLTRSRQLLMLPGGRRRLLASCLAVLTLIGIVFAVAMQILYANYPLDHREVLAKAFIIAFLMFAMLYALLWVVSQAKSALMMLSGMLLLLPCLLLPFRYVQAPSTSIAGPLIVGSLLMAIGSVLYLSWPKDRRLALPWGKLVPASVTTSKTGGRSALARYLRLSHPIVVALIQVIPLGLASAYISEPNLWLFYFVLCSVMSGASANRAASRTRSLWLLLPGSRAALYLKVESAFWRHNAYAILMLAALLVVLGQVRGLSTELLAIGIPLLLIGFALGLYLGLMTTGRLKFLDSVFAVASTSLMMVLAYYADRASAAFVLGSLGLLVIAAVAFRESSRRRWRVIDWAENRPERAAS